MIAQRRNSSSDKHNKRVQVTLDEFAALARRSRKGSVSAPLKTCHLANASPSTDGGYVEFGSSHSSADTVKISLCCADTKSDLLLEQNVPDEAPVCVVLEPVSAH